MGFTTNESMCRVEFFKPSPSGKWYTTEEVNFKGLYEYPPHEALKIAISKLGRLSDMVAVCFDPHVKHSFPVMVYPSHDD
ncbi:MAG: hypothetical protein R3321_00975 [Nitrososphaeraceae archaeon]|nr:hypothetical protein [Nitrososphaeraceae archaeon]